MVHRNSSVTRRNGPDRLIEDRVQPVTSRAAPKVHETRDASWGNGRLYFLPRKFSPPGGVIQSFVHAVNSRAHAIRSTVLGQRIILRPSWAADSGGAALLDTGYRSVLRQI